MKQTFSCLASFHLYLIIFQVVESSHDVITDRHHLPAFLSVWSYPKSVHSLIFPMFSLSAHVLCPIHKHFLIGGLPVSIPNSGKIFQLFISYIFSYQRLKLLYQRRWMSLMLTWCLSSLEQWTPKLECSSKET